MNKNLRLLTGDFTSKKNQNICIWVTLPENFRVLRLLVVAGRDRLFLFLVGEGSDVDSVKKLTKIRHQAEVV